jgi:cardiolipin synthase (CMP-forming)
VGKYRARDLVNGPTLVSWLRVPLAALFPLSAGTPWASVCVLAAAGLSDVLDGWLARRSSLATPAGAVVDGVTDKLFAGAVLATLVARGELALGEVALLGAREVGELPLVLWILASPAARRRKLDDRANLLGKLATTLQFATVLAVLVGAARARGVGLWATAVVGLAAAASYWARALRAQRRERR